MWLVSSYNKGEKVQARQLYILCLKSKGKKIKIVAANFAFLEINYIYEVEDSKSKSNSTLSDENIRSLKERVHFQLSV